MLILEMKNGTQVVRYFKIDMENYAEWPHS